jgi:glycosyltransferase involved in cell wall biosynthesis
MSGMSGKFVARMKRHLENYQSYLWAREVKRYLAKSRNAKSLEQLEKSTKVISLKPEKPSQGNVLLSYYLGAFLLEPGQPVPRDHWFYWHPNYWECLQMARTFLELGYSVDVIDWTNNTFVPQKNYAFFIDVRWNLQRLARRLNKDCLKIMHIDVAHRLQENAAEANRLLALQQRKGVTLVPRRFEVPNLGIEHADCATMYGNEFTLNTYSYANKPIYRVPISTTVLYPWPEEKDFQACRNRFLWLGSTGLVRKGLDLVLDAFAEMPEFDLTVCGPIQRERDFEKAYYKELYQTPNIHTVGWIDTASPEFIEITKNCIGLVYTSCSEGGGGSVIVCMHAGLIPIVNYESSVDVDDAYGVMLNESSIEEIKKAVWTISSLSTQQLRERARRAWEFARANHTREKFADEYRKVVTKIIASHYSRSTPGSAAGVLSASQVSLSSHR